MRRGRGMRRRRSPAAGSPARPYLEGSLPPEATPVGTFMANPVKVQVGGAIAFVMDVERFERF